MPLYHLTKGPSVSCAFQGTSKQYNGMENIFKIVNHKSIRNQVALCLIEGRFPLIMLLGRERQLKDFKWEPPFFSIHHICNKNKHFFMLGYLAMSELAPAMSAAYQRVFHSEGL